jgi:small-conductance mechanosensitive channel
MSELFSAQRIAEIGDLVYQWLLMNVFVVGNAVQALVIVLALGAALLISRRLTAVLERFKFKKSVARLVTTTLPLMLPLVWLGLQWIAILTASAMLWPNHLLVIMASLLTAWVVIRLASQLVSNPVWSTMIAWIAWSIAALIVVDLLEPTIAVLDSAAITIGRLRISLYTVVSSTLALAVLLSIAIYLTGFFEARIRTSRVLSPSVQVLFAKSLKIVLIGLAILIAIRSVGIDLTALAVVGGALGLGVGFGLQKVVSNLVSGVILLLDRSIKPGDVIAVSGTYGWVTALGGRYVSVVTRDGVEHLIPNETLIVERVENWTHTDSQTRLKVQVGVHYDTDLPKAIELCCAAAGETERVLSQPEPKCLFIGFGDSALELEIRFWIADAQNGVQNVKSAILLKIWHTFREHGIEIPYPQRDLHLRSAGELVSVIQKSAA